MGRRPTRNAYQLASWKQRTARESTLFGAWPRARAATEPALPHSLFLADVIMKVYCRPFGRATRSHPCGPTSRAQQWCSRCRCTARLPQSDDAVAAVWVNCKEQARLNELCNRQAHCMGQTGSRLSSGFLFPSFHFLGSQTSLTHSKLCTLHISHCHSLCTDF